MSYFRKHLITFEELHDIRKHRINVSIEDDVIGSVNSQKTVLFRLSDDEDLFFLYSTLITNEEFNNLKCQQGLLVDFSGFGQKVIDLLQLCLDEELSNNPKYSLKFSRDPSDCSSIGVLQIIEATNFKYLVHLSLNLNVANDFALKNHLVSLIKSIRAESESEIKKLQNIGQEFCTKLNSCKNELETLRDDYECYKTSTSERESRCKQLHDAKCAQFEKELVSAKEAYDELLTKQTRRSEDQIESLRSEHATESAILRRDNDQLLDEKKMLEVKVKVLLEQSHVLSTQNTSMKEELIGLRSHLSSLEKINETSRTTIDRLETRLSSLEGDLEKKQQAIVRNKESLDGEQGQRVRCQEELQLKCQQVEKLENLLKHETEENTKANEIISRLQNEVRSYHTKAKLRGQVATEQERLLSSKESELREVRNEADRLAAEVRECKEKITTLNGHLKGATDDLDEARKTIKTNENIIAWLNRQISEAQLGHLTQRLKSTSPGIGAPIVSVSTTSLTGNSSTNTGALMSAGSQQIGCLTTRPHAAVSDSSSLPSWQRLRGSTIPSLPVNGTANIPTTTTSSSSTTAGFSQRSVPFSTTDRESSIGSVMSKYSGNLPSTAYGEKGSLALPAPVTKSTPLHQSHSTTTRGAGNDRYTSNLPAPSGSVDVHSHMPCYLPSTLATAKPGGCQPTTTAPPAFRDMDGNLPGVQSSAAATAGARRPLFGTERMLQQQSLTSAYFPKPVGTDLRQ